MGMGYGYVHNQDIPRGMMCNGGTVVWHVGLARSVRCLDCHTQQLSTTSHMCAVILHSLPPLLSPLSSSPVLLNVGVDSAVLEVGVGVIGALP